MLKKKGSAYDPTLSMSSVKRGGGGFLSKAYMAASRTGSFVFIVYATHNGNRRINS